MSIEPPKPPPTDYPERPEAFDLSSFPCPRCETQTAAEMYGPCSSCVNELQATQVREKSEIEAAAYEPKMNVTPNAVALKD